MAMSSEDVVERVKQNILAEFDAEVSKGKYDQRDFIHVCTDAFIANFVKIGDENLQKSLDLLRNCLAWRMTFKVNDIKIESISTKVIQSGVLFVRNHDKENRPILVFAGKKHLKDVQSHESAKKLFVYLLEDLYKRYQYKGKIMCLFDMSGSGLTNLDMQFVKFVINCFESYYPGVLGVLVILELPWTLNAAWKIIKGWLSKEALEIIKVIKKNEIKGYIAEDQLFSHLGGTDDYIYSPDILTCEEEDNETYEDAVTSDDLEVSINGIKDESERMRERRPRRRVRFNEEIEEIELERDTPTGIRQRSRDIIEASAISPNLATLPTGVLLAINPLDELVFTGPNTPNKDDVYEHIVLTNHSQLVIAFKIKTTSPENYKVRPSVGLISPMSSVSVSITLLAGRSHLIIRDKFLILSAVMTEKTRRNDIVSWWKLVLPNNIIEHRLLCRFAISKDVEDGFIASRTGELGEVKNLIVHLTTQIGVLKGSVDKVQRDMKRVNTCLTIIGCIIILIIFLVLSYFLYFFCASNRAGMEL